ncbi:GGDEF domain-containing protein [Alteromonas facilis]|uniref:GGDEF domain-containing protein n=1 Tax=Alteromonas facilis TaxID=2048004 RepID=UPI000C2925BE|nr:GGDEF domain-containing protein [Alteromonas facilis]
MSKKQLDALKQQNEQLAQFIIRLSNFYQGANDSIDQEMKVLRSHISGTPNYTLATVSIGKINQLLMQNAKTVKKQTSETLGRLESAVKRLQGIASIPDNLKSETARFLSSLSMHNGDMFSSFPQFEQAMQLYQQALDNTHPQKEVKASKQAAGKDTGSTDKVEIPIDASLHSAISNELQQLIEPYYQKNPKDKQLADIRNKLLDGLSANELMECCLVFIRLIVKEVVKEVGVNVRVIDQLHQSLIKMNKDIDSTISVAQQKLEQKIEQDAQLQTHIDDLGDAVVKSEDLSALKNQAQQYLTKIQTTMDERKEADKEEQKALITLLESLQRELSSMEKTTLKYRKKLIEQRTQTHTDPLTRIPNRIAYNERIEQEFNRWQRHKTPLCIAVIDIDHFKQINDKYGHAAGDKTLQVIAKQLKSNLRKTDFLARWGGEEFVALFPDSSLSDILEPLDELRRKLAALPFKFKQEPVTITASFGVAQFNSSDSIETVFDRADGHLYKAKNNGRNQIVSD